MTTYLATVAPTSTDPLTKACCSIRCREILMMNWDFYTPDFRDDDAYEFDEHCANCGVLVSQAPLRVGDLVQCSDGDVCIVEVVSMIDPLAWLGRTEVTL